MVTRAVAQLLLAVFWLAWAEENAEWKEGESLFDDPPAQDWKEGESLFDDPPVQEGESLFDAPAAGPVDDPNAILFGSDLDLKLTNDMVFDETGNVKEGGSTNPDITFWHVVEFNGEEMFEPTHGSAKLLAALESGDSYTVKLSPPNLNNVKCTEKVDPLNVVLDREYHDMAPELVSRALQTLAEEGVMNTKQLGELHEKDYDAIKIPAIVKSRLRPVRAEAKRQAKTANNPVEIDSQEIADEMAEFMAAKKGKTAETGTAEPAAPANEQKPAAAAGTAVVEEDEEDGTFKSLVWAIMNCPTCKGKETISCLRTCRYGREGQQPGWQECLNECITNSWIRATFSVLLPRS